MWSVVKALRAALSFGPSQRPFEPYARALEVHHTRGWPSYCYVRYPNGAATRRSSRMGFTAARSRVTLEETALAACQGRVLDVGAGAGRHALLLQERGLAVTALDCEPRCVDLMRARGVHDTRLGDIFEFRDGPFDTVLFVESTVGLVGTITKLMELLEHLKPLLNDGGRVILDSASPIGAFTHGIGYPGCVELQLVFRLSRGESFPWLYVDYDVLAACADARGYSPRLLLTIPDRREYAAILTKRS